jgi:protein-L-isoaspartate(D-aspartate) O-methyltransferase
LKTGGVPVKTIKKSAFLIAVLLLFCSTSSAEQGYQQQRDHLVQRIKDNVALNNDYLLSEHLDARVLDVMRFVPRHEFVPQKYRKHAYKNRPLPIGYGQTISQPVIVAIMTDLLHLKQSDQVLEIGTGSGYQAAVLARLVEKVYSIEIVEELFERSSHDLKRLGFDNVVTRSGDGYFGWPEQAPFDRIIVTAANSHIPPSLIKQLKPGGRMVLPVGGRFMLQHLVLVIKDAEGNVTTQQLLPVKFVPLTGQH